MPRKVNVLNLESSVNELSALIEVSPEGEQRFSYSVYTRGNGLANHLDPLWWDRHPDWTLFVRSDFTIKYCGRLRYLGQGGVVLAETLETLCRTIAAYAGSATAFGTESLTPIDMEAK